MTNMDLGLGFSLRKVIIRFTLAGCTIDLHASIQSERSYIQSPAPTFALNANANVILANKVAVISATANENISKPLIN